MTLREALDFYKLLLSQHADRTAHYRAKKIAETMSVNSDWVCFAAYLVDDEGSESTTGPDLVHHEVKSGLGDGSYEYQYHKHSWDEKLTADSQVDHVFISRSTDLQDVTVHRSLGAALRSPFFDVWRREILDAGGYTTQRFRRSIPRGWVRANSELILHIKSGVVVPKKR